jgi:hypothetical protein
MSERPITFCECLAVCTRTPGLVSEFDRLTGCNLSGRGSPLELEIDRVTGRMDADFARFVEFVRDCVWDRLPADAKADLSALVHGAADEALDRTDTPSE